MPCWTLVYPSKTGHNLKRVGITIAEKMAVKKLQFH